MTIQKRDKTIRRLKVTMENLRTGEHTTMVYGQFGWRVLDVAKVRR